MLIKIIDKYIIQELVKVFLISVGTLTMVLYLDKFLFMAEMIVNRGVSFLEMCLIMLYISPSFLALTRYVLSFQSNLSPQKRGVTFLSPYKSVDSFVVS